MTFKLIAMKPWSDFETTQLEMAIKRHGKNWKKHPEALPDRSIRECKKMLWQLELMESIRTFLMK